MKSVVKSAFNYSVFFAVDIKNCELLGDASEKLEGSFRIAFNLAAPHFRDMRDELTRSKLYEGDCLQKNHSA
jgi:hypothetical protein